jgi:hypothetical protein
MLRPWAWLGSGRGDDDDNESRRRLATRRGRRVGADLEAWLQASDASVWR